MVTQATRNLTFQDFQNRMDPDGSIADIVEILQQQNPLLRDAVFKEANGKDYNQTTIRSSLPEGTWNRYNRRIRPTKSSTSVIIDTVSDLEAYSEINKKLIDREPDKRIARYNEDAAFLEGLMQQATRTALYGNDNTNPDEFLGFMNRFNRVSSSINSNNVIDAGGTGSDNTSILGVVWDDNVCCMIKSKNEPTDSSGVIQMRDLGEDSSETAEGRVQVYLTHFLVNLGLTIKDWRGVFRIANIDVSALQSDASSGTNLVNRISSLCSRLNARFFGKRKAIYMNQTVYDALLNQRTNFENVLNMQKDVFGYEVEHARGIPIRVVDQIVDTEARIT